MKSRPVFAVAAIALADGRISHLKPLLEGMNPQHPFKFFNSTRFMRSVWEECFSSRINTLPYDLVVPAHRARFFDSNGS